MRPVLIRRAVTIAAAAALGLAVGVPASGSVSSGSVTTGSVTTGWSVSKTLGPASGVWADLFSADSANDAWSTWTALGNFSVEHWTGSAWSAVPVPSSLLKYAKSSVAIGASSASDAWLFSHGHALRWTGTAWQLQAIPTWVVQLGRAGNYNASAAVFGSRSVWVFSDGLTTASSERAAHWNGHGWSKIALPGVFEDLSALAPDDIWALGITPASAGSTKPVYILMHWNGTGWSTQPLPKVTVPKGASEYPGALTATGSSSAWLTWDIEQGTGGAQTKYLLHWNGTSWAQVKLTQPTSDISYLAQDGHGAVWAVSNGPAPSYTWYLDHWSAGTWTRDTVPVASGLSLLDLTGLTWIPGSGTLWATGNMANGPSGNQIYGAILTGGA